MNPPLHVFTVRPDGRSLWLPEEVARAIAAKDGARLTIEQYTHRKVQELLATRQLRKKGEEFAI